MSTPEKIFFELIADPATGEVQALRLFAEELAGGVDAAAVYSRLCGIANELGAGPDVVCGDDFMLFGRSDYCARFEGRPGVEVPRGLRLFVHA